VEEIVPSAVKEEKSIVLHIQPKTKCAITLLKKVQPRKSLPKHVRRDKEEKNL